MFDRVYKKTLKSEWIPLELFSTEGKLTLKIEGCPGESSTSSSCSKPSALYFYQFTLLSEQGHTAHPQLGFPTENTALPIPLDDRHLGRERKSAHLLFLL